jgi:hypothetical protein
MVELGKNTAWAWEETMLTTDATTMVDFYNCPGNHMKFWTPAADSP